MQGNLTFKYSSIVSICFSRSRTTLSCCNSRFLKTALFLLVLLTVNLAKAEPDSLYDRTESERTLLLQKIKTEKDRVAKDFTSADKRFFNLVDSVMEFVRQRDVTRERKNIYYRRVYQLLKNINRYYSDNYLKSGTYLAILSYYPLMIEWDQQGELLQNLKRYYAFSVRATRMIPNDDVAEDFLTEYMKDHPDDIFRYTDEFDDRKFAMHLLEKALRFAPESAKRYYTSNNSVTGLLKFSNDPYVRKSIEIFSRYGLRSRAYLLLDAIQNNEMTLGKADSIGENPDQLFRLLVQRSMKYEASITYSIYRYMDIYSIDAMRKINQESLNPGSRQFETFKKYSPEEMFILLSYGYKETTISNLRLLLEILKKASIGVPVNGVMINSMDKNKLKDLVLFCDKNEMLEPLLALVDDPKKEYLLALTTLEEKENIFPPFKTFMRDNPITKTEAEDKSMAEITKAQPPKPVVPDAMEDGSGMTKPEKIVPPVKKDNPAPSNAPVSAKPITSSEPAPVALNNIKESVSAKKDIVLPPLPDAILEPFKIQLDGKTKAVVALKKNVLATIQNIPKFLGEPYAEEVLRYAGQKEPDEMFKKIYSFKSQRYCLKILEVCADNAPVSVKRYLYNSMNPVTYILKYSADPVVKKIFEINTAIGYHTKPLLLLDDMVNGKMDVKDAIAISEDPVKLFNEVVSIISRPKFVGKYSIDHEMRDYSLRFIREINDKIAGGAGQPFSSVEGLNSADLYFLMLYGRDEVFTSTFTGLFNRFMKKLPGNNGEEFLKSVSYNRYRDFLSLCAGFGTANDFLAHFPAESKKNLLQSYIAHLEDEKDDLNTVALIAEAISNITDNVLLSQLETNIKTEYERVKADSNQIGISLYGVLSSIISANVKVETNWYKKVAQQFKISPVGSLNTGILFNPVLQCIEQMYFYNDEDGRSSYVNFISTYRNSASWRVEDKNSYVRVYALNGKDVQIFANKPEFEDNGISAIGTYFHENDLTPSVVVHRGHSFHTEATLEKITSSAKLIFVGSCGGFYKISIALENAPDAHIIATKQIGTKTLNDGMLLALNESIRMGKEIVWNDFWAQMRTKFGSSQYFSDYVPPNKNLESIFIRAYYKILGV